MNTSSRRSSANSFLLFCDSSHSLRADFKMFIPNRCFLTFSLVTNGLERTSSPCDTSSCYLSVSGFHTAAHHHVSEHLPPETPSNRPVPRDWGGWLVSFWGKISIWGGICFFFFLMLFSLCWSVGFLRGVGGSAGGLGLLRREGGSQGQKGMVAVGWMGEGARCCLSAFCAGSQFTLKCFSLY